VSLNHLFTACDSVSSLRMQHGAGRVVESQPKPVLH
jgi:hypothetical protein